MTGAQAGPVCAALPTRDHAADADASLERKRPRLSEEAENDSHAQSSAGQDPIVIDSTNSSSSSPGSVRIEAEAPEDIAPYQPQITNLDDRIDMELPYADTFPYDDLSSNFGSPDVAMKEFARYVDNENELDPKHMNTLAEWMLQHLESTANEESVWHRKYSDGKFFWEKLAELFMNMSWRKRLCPLSKGTTARLKKEYRDLCSKLFRCFSRLSVRFMTFQGRILDAWIKRRDSAVEGHQGKHEMPFANYLGALSRFTADSTPLHALLTRDYGMDVKALRADCLLGFKESPDVVNQLTELLTKLSARPNDTGKAWDTIDWIVHLAASTFCALTDEDVGHFQGARCLEVIDTVHSVILPAVSAKHPGGLPDSFHERLVEHVSSMISIYVRMSSDDEAYQLYARFIESIDDGLLPEKSHDETSKALLMQVCGCDKDLLAQLLATAWMVQALKSYIFSENMNVRGPGVKILAGQLVKLYKKHRSEVGGADHAVIQYLARFLRTNELTKYLFSPNSRPELVRNSGDIIGFLAATGTYTCQETDIIWDACTTRVEAEFVEAAFHVLSVHLKDLLGYDNLLYAARKYAVTPVTKLGPHAVAFFREALLRLHIEPGDQFNRLATASLSLQVLHSTAQAPIASDVVGALRAVALNDLTRFGVPSANPLDRLAILQQCVPEVLQHSPTASASIEAISVVLLHISSTEGMEVLTDMLPLPAAVDEFCAYVQRERIRQSPAFDFRSYDTRVRLLVKMISNVSLVQPQLEKRLLDHLVGDDAISNATRSYAWDVFAKTANDSGTSEETQLFLDRCLSLFVPTLSADCATPNFVPYLANSINSRLTELNRHKAPDEPLTIPLIEQLVRIALETPSPRVAKDTVMLVLDIVFQRPTKLHMSPTLVTDMQIILLRSWLNGLGYDYRAVIATSDTLAERRFDHGIELLRGVLDCSRTIIGFYQFPIPSDAIVVGEKEPGKRRVTFTAQVHAGKPQPSIQTVDASEDATIGDLQVAVAQSTGCKDFDIINGGHLLNLDAMSEMTLAEFGLKNPGVLLIRLKHTSDCDPSLILTHPGPLEREVVGHFSELHTLLEGPTNRLAKQAYKLLGRLSPPGSIRRQVQSVDFGLSDLFPAGSTWKAIYTIDVMLAQLSDFAKLGIADASYILRCVHLLIELITDDGRVVAYELLTKAAQGLQRFLQERPTDEVSSEYFKAPQKFVARVVALIQHTIQDMAAQTDRVELSGNRVEFAKSVFEALLEAVRVSNAVGQSLAAYEDVSGALAGLLLDHDARIRQGVAISLRKFSQDPSTRLYMKNHFWRILYEAMPQAKQFPLLSSEFFDLIQDVFRADEILNSDESQVRAIIDNVSTSLLTYAHAERIDLPLVDMGVLGMSRLLACCVISLRSFKKPIDLRSLPCALYRTLLFPSLQDSTLNPILCVETRRTILELVWSTLSADKHEEMVHLVARALQESSQDLGLRYKDRQTWLREATNNAGLWNLGQTCYMNSMLQQLYMNVEFRKLIFDTPVLGYEKQSLLVALKSAFASMQDSSTPDVDLTNLAQVLGIETSNQEDVHSFYTTFMSALEAQMPDESTKAAFNKLFGGKHVMQIRAECGHVSEKTEPFNDLSIVVKNKGTLQEGLKEFVQGEPLQGADRYKCLTCDAQEGGLLVNAFKRTSLTEIPDNLAIPLKRFTYEAMLGDGSKVNDRFEFPQSIDMSVYTLARLDDPGSPAPEDIFELVGVIVHSGTLQLGHYWSYVRERGSRTGRWVRLEDYKVGPSSFEEVQNECFGGSRWNNSPDRIDNAYVLFYQRKTSIEQSCSLTEHSDFHETLQDLLPSKVKLPPDLYADIEAANRQRHRIAQLFDSCHITSVKSLIHSFEASESETNAATAITMVNVAADYLFRVVMCSHSLECFQDILQDLHGLIGQNVQNARHLLQKIVMIKGLLKQLLMHEKVLVRKSMNKLILACLRCIREHDAHGYGLDSRRALGDLEPPTGAFYETAKGMYDIIEQLSDCRPQWADYLELAGDLASMGPYETSVMLDLGYLKWCLEIAMLRVFPEFQREHEWIAYHTANGRKWRTDAVFTFIFRILCEHVDLSDASNTSRSYFQHDLGPKGCYLTAMEWKLLLLGDNRSGYSVSFLIEEAVRRYSSVTNTQWQWEDYVPGKLVALLAGDDVCDELCQLIESTLKHYVKESQDFVPCLLMLSNFCRSTSDVEATKLFINIAAQEIMQFEDCYQVETVAFFDSVYPVCPVGSLRSIRRWALPWLVHRNMELRACVEGFLTKYLFSAPPITMPSTEESRELDVLRLKMARWLVEALADELRKAFDAEKRRESYRSLFEVIAEAITYFHGHHKAVKAILDSEAAADVGDGRDDSVELTAVELLSETYWQDAVNVVTEELSGWEVEVPRYHSMARQSIELEEEGFDEDDDAEYDDDEESQFEIGSEH